MEFYENRYFMYNKFFLSIFGFWPFQGKITRRCRLAFLCIVLMIGFTALMNRYRQVMDDLDSSVDCFIYVVSAFVSSSKIINGVYNREKMKNLLNKIESDWKIWSTEPEFKTIKENAEKGRTLTVLYAIATYNALVIYFVFCLSPQFLDSVMPLENGTRPRVYPIPQDFGVDPEKNYYYLFAYNLLGIFSNFTVSVCTDSMFVVYVQHACGNFEAIGQRLKNIITPAQNEKNEIIDNEYITQEILFCTERHRNVIEYSAQIEDVYSSYLFFLIGVNMALLIFTGVQVVIKMGDFQEMIKFSAYVGLLVVHLFYYSLPGQSISDQSLLLKDEIFSCYWYQMPNSSKKSLLFMMMRSCIPLQITAGKLYVMSMENFSSVLRSAASYFTALCSFR